MITNHEWLLRNELRTYPLREDSVLVATNTGWRLPNSLIADLMVSGDHAASTLCLQSVTITPSICSIVVGDPVTGQSLAVASITRGTTGDVPLQSLVDGVEGFVSFGASMLDEFYPQMARGFHLFGAGAPIESRCVLLSGPMPVTGIVNPAGGTFRGDVKINHSGSLLVTIDIDEEDGVPVQRVTMALADPASMLSPCEEKTSTCGCSSVPIRTINGVPGNESSIIFIEIEDENGNIYLLGTSTLSFLLTRPAGTFCLKAEEPDPYGRIKGGSDSYDDDQPPKTSYKNPDDLTFPQPVI